jgi:hypothetical protein
MFALTARYMPAPPPGVSSPALWGDPNVITERLGADVRDIRFERATISVPVLSPAHQRELIERTAGPVVKLVESLSAADPGKLAAFRSEFEALTAQYFDENLLRQGFLMTRGVKA